MTDFSSLVRGRRMTRCFSPDRLDPSQVNELLDLARGAPSAGNTAALSFLVLEGQETQRYWDITLPDERRSNFSWPGLLDAPVLVVPWVDPEAYVERYREVDKAHTGLGVDQAAWEVPYWFVDGGAAAMTILLGAEAAGLGALLFGLFAHETAVRETFGVPNNYRAVATIALGRARPERSSQSAGRLRPSLETIIHRGNW